MSRTDAVDDGVDGERRNLMELDQARKEARPKAKRGTKLQSSTLPPFPFPGFLALQQHLGKKCFGRHQKTALSLEHLLPSPLPIM